MNKFTLFAIVLIFAALSCKKTDNTVEADPAPSNLTFSAIVSADSNGKVSFNASAINAAAYTFDYGNTLTEVSKTGIVTYQYYTPGVYTVKVTASSTGGKSVSQSAVINVKIITPSNLTLSATVNPDNSGNVSFAASATNAVRYTFDYGNSITEVSSTGIITYKYTSSGVYNVSVTAETAGGITATKFAVVTIAMVQGLVWSDEFDTPGAPSSTRWGYDLGAGGWGNNEVQNYTNRSDNVYVSDGTLKLVLKKENYQGSSYTSARLLTHGKYSFKYGKIEVRAKLPAGGGTWPAIWMLGDNIFTAGIGWPACGEVDIMEEVGNSPGVIHSSIHTTSSFGNTVNTSTKTVGTYNTEFHLYQADWKFDRIEFSIDNVLFYTYKPAIRNSSTWPFDNPCFIILNIAMGGNFGGNVDPAFTSGQMEVDYVRVYQ